LGLLGRQTAAAAANIMHQYDVPNDCDGLRLIDVP
jgi:hypothetical protein